VPSASALPRVLQAPSKSGRQAGNGFSLSFCVSNNATKEDAMKVSMPVLGLAVIGSLAIGAAANQTLHAQAKPHVIVVAEVNVKDKDGYAKEFLPVIVKEIEANGGKYLTRGGATQTLLGDPPPNRVVLVEYDSVDNAMSWWNSKVTQDAIKNMGMKYADFRLYAQEMSQ
jgi:uncharacterized protein (DUF1330 family)